MTLNNRMARRRDGESTQRKASATCLSLGRILDTIKELMIQEFHDELSPFYHLISPDWEASIERQTNILNRITSSQNGVRTFPQLLMSHVELALKP